MNFKKKVSKYTLKISIIIIIIIGITVYFLYRFVRQIDNSILVIGTTELNKINDYILLDLVNNDSLTNLNDLMIIEQNKNGEILYVDYNVDKSYEILKSITNMLTNNYRELDNGNMDILKEYNSDFVEFNNNSMLLNIPTGYMTKYNFFAGIGPIIPVKLMVTGSIKSSLKTDLTSYGINNALLRLFVKIDLEQSIIMPYKKEVVSTQKELLIASKVIEGSVPSFYGGLLEKSTPIVSN